MKTRFAWFVLGLLLLIVFVLTFMKSPDAIAALLTTVSRDLSGYSVFTHVLFTLVLATGLLFRGIRSILFSLWIAFLSLSAAIVSIIYVIIPNMIVFMMFFVLIIRAYRAKQLNFSFEKSSSVEVILGSLALVFGYWYLHWVEAPIWVNAILYSPLGVVNCPTMITTCGFLILGERPRSAHLEAAVGLITLYFGFFGLFRLGASVDIILILCAAFLLMRLVSDVARDALLKESVVTK